MHAQTLTLEKTLPLKSYVFRWLVVLLAVYLVSVLARVEYRMYAQGRRTDTAIEEAKPKLIDYVKSTMFKPASFQFKSIQCNGPSEASPYYELGMHYLANNILGEATPNYIEVLADNDGNIVKVVRE